AGGLRVGRRAAHAPLRDLARAGSLVPARGVPSGVRRLTGVWAMSSKRPGGWGRVRQTPGRGAEEIPTTPDSERATQGPPIHKGPDQRSLLRLAPPDDCSTRARIIQSPLSNGRISPSGRPTKEVSPASASWLR